MGVARQRARGWLIAINLLGLSVSMIMFMLVAVVTSIWLHPALVYTIGGLASGFLLGVISLWLTRWEPTADALFFTPNRLLVLEITLVVTARVLFGFWRAWHTWRAGLEVAAAGVATSMAAGAVVLGYYFVYWLGVRRRLRLQRRVQSARVVSPRQRR